MSSTTSPEATTVPAAPQLTASQIQLGGQTVDLKGFTAADAGRIYPALPADFQQRADQYAVIAKQFERVADIQLPHGMTLTQAFSNYKNALVGGAGKLKGGADPYLLQMDALCRTMPGYEGMVAGFSTAASAASLTGTAVGAAADLAAAPYRFLEFMMTCMREGGNAVAPAITDDQAKAFGTAYAAALYYEGAERQTMGTGALIMKYPGSAILAGLENTALNVPILREAWPYISAAWKWVASALSHIGDKSGEKPLNFTEALAQANAEIAEGRMQNPDWRTNVEHRAQGADFDRATEKMRAAGVVAGVSTAPIADAMQKQSTVLDGQGNMQQLERKGADIKMEKPALTGADGKPLGGTTRGDRITESASNILGQTGKDVVGGHLTLGGYAVVGGVTYGAYRVGNKLGMGEHLANGAKGAAHAGRGLVAGYLQGTADTMSGIDESKPFRNSFAQSHGTLNNIDRLKLVEEAAEEKLHHLQARQPKGGLGIRDWRAERVLKAAEETAKKAHENVAKAEAALGKGPQHGTSKLAEEALKVSDEAAEVMGAANVSRVGVAMRGAGRLVGRAAPVLSAGFAVKDTFDGVQYAREGKGREAAESFAGAGSVAGGAAIGAGIGVWAGGVGAIPCAIVGAGVGGLYDLVGGWFGVGPRDAAGAIYDRVTREPVKPMVAQPDVGLTKAAVEQTQKAQNAAARVGGGMRRVTSVEHVGTGSLAQLESYAASAKNSISQMLFG